MHPRIHGLQILIVPSILAMKKNCTAKKDSYSPTRLQHSGNSLDVGEYKINKSGSPNTTYESKTNCRDT